MIIPRDGTRWMDAARILVTEGGEEEAVSELRIRFTRRSDMNYVYVPLESCYCPGAI